MFLTDWLWLQVETKNELSEMKGQEVEEGKYTSKSPPTWFAGACLIGCWWSQRESRWHRWRTRRQLRRRSGTKLPG